MRWLRFQVGSVAAGFSRAAENIAYGYNDFPSTLKQWINSAGHRANLLLHGAKWIGVAHARNSKRTYWGNGYRGQIAAPFYCIYCE
jgi:uncharacterized protein YkwD